MKTSHIVAAGFLMAATCLVPQIHAAGDSTWSTTPANGDWSNVSNWSVGAPPDGTTGLLTFGTSSTTVLNNDITGVSFNTANAMVFQSGASAYTISGNSLNSNISGNATSFLINNQSTSTQTLNVNMSLTGGWRYINTTTGGGNIVLAGNISGAGSIWFTGTGVVTLSGTNTHTGAVYSGTSNTLQIASAGALGSGLFYAVGKVQNTSGSALTFANNVNYNNNNTWDLAHSLTFTGNFTLNSNRIMTVNATGGDLTLATIKSDNSTIRTLTKAGAGKLRVTGNATTSMVVNAGSLILAGGDLTESTATVSVAVSGAIFGGPGSIAGNTTVSEGAHLAPGADTESGTMNFAQNLSMVGASIVDFKGNDLLDVDGALSLSDTWSLALGTGFQNGGSTTVFTYGSGTFSSAALDAARINAAGLGFTPSGPLGFTDTGSSIVLNGISAIPEPTTWALLAGSLTVLVVTRRRRNV